jgi:hypothetical protein
MQVMEVKILEIRTMAIQKKEMAQNNIKVGEF